MARLEIIDTFHEFVLYWRQFQNQGIKAQINAWNSQYISKWPELQEKLIDCYTEEGEDWRAIAQDHILPQLSDRLPLMRLAHSNLLEVIPKTFRLYQQTFSLAETGRFER